MANKYTTKVNLGGGVGKDYSKKKPKKASNRNKSTSKGKFYTSGVWDKTSKKAKKDSKFATWQQNSKLGKATASIRKKLTAGLPNSSKKRVAKIMYGLSVFVFIFMFVGIISGLAYMQSITRDLPDPERPFENEKFQIETSIMYDRNGEELYRLFADDNRNIIKMSDDQELAEVVPPELIWSFLAAEDIDFYEHPGFDIAGIVRCGSRYVFSGEASCGGSTITQQVVKIAALEDNTRELQRKLKELVLSLQLERTISDKDKILLLYLNIVPEGGNIYGVQTAARQYFNKEVTELSLEESVTLAAIVNEPALLAPYRSYNAEIGAERLEFRRQYIFDNLLRYKDQINREVRATRERIAQREGRELTEAEQQPFITEERIESSRNVEMNYQPPSEEINAPHFVFFVRDLLQARGYNNGQPFTQQEINTGGYKIYTTLDLDIHNTALDVVQNVAINQYGSRYGNKNAALMTMKPNTGEILAFVGSKCYNNQELEGCTELDKTQGDQFDPQVNILTSQQQPGSSIKPIVFYDTFRQGKMAPASKLADIPIEIGNYKPRNSDGKFVGVQSARWMLAQSRNIPAITALLAGGIENFVEVKKNIGYTTNVDPATYGPSSALGSQDVLAVDHATAYATFANGGKYVPYEAILKIEDKNGNVIYELGSDKKELDYRPDPEQVLDERAVFLTNDSTNPNSQVVKGLSPVKWSDNRDMSGKTGTSENNRDNWFVQYSPDFVTVGWAGNNDNSRMANNAFGSTNAEPWVREFMQRVGNSDYFNARTPYSRPGGVTRGGICGEIEIGSSKQEVCEGGNDYLISGLVPPVYVSKRVAEVCVDQEDRLAREIDKVTGNSVERTFDYVRMPVDSLQDDLDKFLNDKQGSNGPPTEQCNVNRSPNGELPWAQIANPVFGTTYTNSIPINVTAFANSGNVSNMEFSLDGQILETSQNNSFTGSVSIPENLISGTYEFTVTVTDSNGRIGNSSVSVQIDGIDPDISLNAPAAGSKPVNTPIVVNISYDNDVLSNIEFCVENPSGSVNCLAANASAGTATYNWTPTNTGTYTIWARANNPIIYESTTRSVEII